MAGLAESKQARVHLRLDVRTKRKLEGPAAYEGIHWCRSLQSDRGDLTGQRLDLGKGAGRVGGITRTTLRG